MSIESIEIQGGKFGDIKIIAEGDPMSGKSVLIDKMLKAISEDPWYNNLRVVRQTQYGRINHIVSYREKGCV